MTVVVVGGELEGDEEFREPKAFSAALRTIFRMGSALVSAFVSGERDYPDAILEGSSYKKNTHRSQEIMTVEEGC